MEFGDFCRWFTARENDLASTYYETFRPYYEEALEVCLPLRPYCTGARLFARLVFNYAAHVFIVTSESMPEPEGNLYKKYKIGEFGGFVSSASNEATSVGYATPEGVTEGGFDDYFFSSTPYGRQYLAVLEQVRPLAVT